MDITAKTLAHPNIEEPVVVVNYDNRTWFLAAQMAAFMHYGGKNRDPLKCMGSGVSSFIQMGDPSVGTHVEEGIHYVSFNKKKEREEPAKVIQKYANDDINELYRRGRLLLVSREGLDLWMERRMTKSPTTVELRQHMRDIYANLGLPSRHPVTLFQKNEDTSSELLDIELDVYSRNDEEFYDLNAFAMLATTKYNFHFGSLGNFYLSVDDGLDHRLVQDSSQKGMRTYIRVETARLFLERNAVLKSEAPSFETEEVQSTLDDMDLNQLILSVLANVSDENIAKGLYQYFVMGESQAEAIQNEYGLSMDVLKRFVRILQVGSLAYKASIALPLSSALSDCFDMSSDDAADFVLRTGLYTDHYKQRLAGTSFYQAEIQNGQATLTCFCGQEHTVEDIGTTDPQSVVCEHDAEKVRLMKLLYGNGVSLEVIAQAVNITDSKAIAKMQEFLEGNEMRRLARDFASERQ